MEEISFQLQPGKLFIPLDQLLKLTGMANSGGEAHKIIQEGVVMVNDQVEMQKRKKMKAGDTAVLDDVRITVTSEA